MTEFLARTLDRLTAWLTVASVVVVSVVVITVTPTKGEATSIVPFTVAFSANENGSIAIIGNNLMVCPTSASDCAGARAGTNNVNNNGFNMTHLDVDGGAFPTFSSSSAQMVLPTDAAVVWAGLYWGARLGRGSGGAAATGNGTQMRLRAPGDAAYRTIVAGQFFGPSATADRAYQAFADVTSIVQAAGPGNYFGADVPAATGEDRYSGWSLVIVYRAPSLPLRNLTVFNGLADVGRDDPQNITISGFTTPVTGTVNSRIGLVAYEGDRGSSGDRAIFNGTQLGTTLSQGTNFFNGANDNNGTLVTARSPADVNMLGFDIKNFDAPGILANNATSAQINLASTSERYFPGVATTAIDVFAPDFSPSTKTVANLTGGDPVRVGDTLRYTVTFVNAGQDPAVSTSIEDPIPAGTTFVPGSLSLPAGVTGSFDSVTNAVLLTPGNFPIGRSVTYTFDVLVGTSAANTNVSNQATIVYDGATVPELQNLRFTTGAAAIAVVASANLSVTKVNSPATVVAGNTLASTITVRNDGPSPAANVVVTDELPAGLSTVTATASQGSCTPAAGLVTCQLGSVASGAVVTITVEAVVPPGSTVASLTDIARVTSPTSDPDPGDNTSGATSGVTRNADLSVTKTVSPATVSPGGVLTYTLTATNNGPSTATSVVIDDDVSDSRIRPQSASSLPSGPCSFDASTARCTIPSLAPGASAVMTVSALALPGATPGVVPNQAIVSSATPDGDAANNNAEASVTIGPPVSDLVVAKTADAPSPLIAGLGEVRYRIDVSNVGPSDANPVSVSDELPPGFVVTAVTTDRGQCVIAADAGSVSCDLGLLLAPLGTNPGSRAVIRIVAQVPPGVEPGSYSNVATADAPSSSPTSSPAAAVTVASLADVSIIKSFPDDAADQTITPGNPATYRIRIVNDGPSVAADVVVTDTLPAGVTATAWGVGPVTPAGPTPLCDVATVSCDLGDLPPGTTVELELDVFVDGGLVVDPVDGVANTADVTSSTDDPNDANNTSTFVAAGAASADLSIRKFPPNNSPIAGDDSPDTLADRSFLLEIANFGPSTATGMTFTDELPPGVTFVRVYDPVDPTFDLSPFIPCTVAGTSETGQTVSCDLNFPGGLPAFIGTFFAIEFVVDPTVPDGTVLQNDISFASEVADNNPGNNTSTALVPVRAVANLRVTKLVGEVDANGSLIRSVPEEEDPLELPAGHDVAFFFEVVNDGPSAAADVAVRDNFELPSAPLFGGECEVLTGDVVCRYSNAATDDLLLPGELFFSQSDFVALGGVEQGVYTNTLTVTTSTEETTLEDNVDTRDIEIVDPIADVIIDKTALTSPLVAGETFTYQIAVRAGLIDIAVPVVRFSSNAEDVVITDTLPPELTPSAVTTSQGECIITGQAVSCELGTVVSQVSIDPVAPALVTITGTVAPGATGDTLDNTAVATTSTPLRGGGDSVASATSTPLTRSADLAVTKVASSDTAAAGGGMTFTLTVTNTGPSDATSVELIDLLPPPFVFSADGSDPTCSLAGDDVVCDLGTVTAGVPRVITIAATLPPDAAPDSVTNTASVGSDVDDPHDTDNWASVDIAVVQAADLAVTKTPAAEGVLLGGTMTYNLTVVNQGPSNTTGVMLTETIPTGTTVATLPPGCTGTGPVECDIGDLAAGDAVTLVLVLEVPDTLSPGPLDNIASVTSDLDDSDLTNNAAATTVEAVAEADVAITKELVTPNPVAGEPLEFRLTVVNNGPTVAPNASISDTLEPGLTFVSASASQGTCTLDEAETTAVTASCDLGRMGVGAIVTATLVVDTDPSLTTISNTAFAGSGGLDTSTFDNEDGLEFALRAVSDLSVTKSGPAVVSAVAPVEYLISFRNDGPSTALDVFVSDTLPTGLTPRAVSGCTVSATNVSCPVGSLAPGVADSITITADVDPNLPLGTELTDVASIRSDAPGFEDPDPGDNTSTLTSTVRALNDVGVTVTANQDEVTAGARVSYTVVVVNNGPHLASGVVLANDLPPELVDIAVEGSGPFGQLVEQVPSGCDEDGRTVTCDLGDMTVAESRSLVFSGTVAAGTPAASRLVNTATVTFDGTDAVAANNSDVDSILVIASVTPVEPPPATNPPGQLPSTGAALVVLLALAASFVTFGGGLNLIGAPRSHRRGARR